MKRLGKIAVCLAGCMALNASLCAAAPLATDVKILKKKALNAGMQSSAPAPVPAPAANPLADNPYSTIVVRNIFGLIPPTPPPDTSAEDLEASLPKIIPTGIMGVFGDWQVLFKVSPAKPAPGTKDEFYSLSEGQRQDDIEVVKIDSEKSIVTFNNHGTTQKLPLSDAPSSSGSGAMPSSPPPGMGNPGMMPSMPGGGNNGPGGFTRFGAGYGGNNGGMANVNSGFNNGGGAENGANGSTATANDYVSPQFQDTLPPEARIVLMEAQRMQWQQQQGKNPALIPPTPLTQFNTPDGNTPDGGGPPAP